MLFFFCFFFVVFFVVVFFLLLLFLPYMSTAVSLFNGVEAFEQTVNIPLTEGTM